MKRKNHGAGGKRRGGGGRVLAFLLSVWLLLQSAIIVAYAAPEGSDGTPELKLNCKSAVLMEASSGKVLYAENQDEAFPPASVTKIMTLLLVMEALDSGKIKFTDTVTASAHACSMGGSQIYLKEGETMSVEDLLKSICIASANDAMVAMAEQISGTQEAFVERMNEKAQELKLSNTHFTNASGLHDPQHYSCASDMARIASALLQEGGEELLAITGTYDAYIREDSAQKFWLVNTNKLIRQMQGADGLKTGYTDQAGSCITATACRNSLRLIAVVMHEPDSATRNQETIQLLEYGFSRYEQKQLYAAGDEVDTLTIEKGDPSRVGLIAREDAYFMYEKGKESKVSSTKIELVKKELPYDPKDTVARAHVKMSDGYTFTVDLGVKEAVRPMSFLQLWIRALREMFA